MLLLLYVCIKEFNHNRQELDEQQGGIRWIDEMRNDEMMVAALSPKSTVILCGACGFAESELRLIGLQESRIVVWRESCPSTTHERNLPYVESYNGSTPNLFIFCRRRAFSGVQ